MELKDFLLFVAATGMREEIEWEMLPINDLYLRRVMLQEHRRGSSFCKCDKGMMAGLGQTGPYAFQW